MDSDGNAPNARVKRSAAAVNEIKDRIRRGEYRVDERAVADAILRRRRELAARGAQARAIDRSDN